MAELPSDNPTPVDLSAVLPEVYDTLSAMVGRLWRERQPGVTLQPRVRVHAVYLLPMVTRTLLLSLVSLVACQPDLPYDRGPEAGTPTASVAPAQLTVPLDTAVRTAQPGVRDLRASLTFDGPPRPKGFQEHAGLLAWRPAASVPVVMELGAAGAEVLLEGRHELYLGLESPGAPWGPWGLSCAAKEGCPTAERTAGALVERWDVSGPWPKHSFILKELPAGPLQLHVNTDAAVERGEGAGALSLVTASGAWSYAGLRAFDANDRTVSASMRGGDSQILVDIMGGAHAPITVDPTLMPGQEILSGTFMMGVKTSGADINNDGFDDLIAPGAWPTLAIYFGSSAGPDPSSLYYDGFGGFGRDLSASASGDLTGDGIADLALGFPESPRDTAFLLCPGREHGWVCPDYSAPLLEIPGYEYSSLTNGSAVSISDVTADGIPDLVGSPHIGAASIWAGRRSGGIDLTPLTLDDPHPNQSLTSLVMTADGDVNGDGIHDILSSAPGCGHLLGSGAPDALLYLGAPGGPARAPVWRYDTYDTEGCDPRYFYLAPDLNGDGYDDAVGFGYRPVWVPGGPGGLTTPRPLGYTDATCIDLVGQYCSFTAVTPLGDINADGFGDLLVAHQNIGLALLYLGSPDGPLTQPYGRFDVAPSEYGGGPAGDTNADGFIDYVVIARAAQRPENDDIFYVYLGGPLPDPDADEFEAPLDCEPNRPYAWPGAPELPGNPVDDDCDGWMTCYVDLDGDGDAGSTTTSVPFDRAGCFSPGLGPAYVDCDDARVDFGASAPDVPDDDLDQDCDGTWACIADLDHDGFGSPIPAGLPEPCSVAADTTADTQDCDDARSDIHPGGTETVRDPADEDCDGTTLCRLDADLDGHGVINSSVLAPFSTCDHPGFSPLSDDCNDSAPESHPGGVEVVGNEEDEDCDGRVTCYSDRDLDGWGTEILWSGSSCLDAGYAPVSGDCDDREPLANPGALEVDWLPATDPWDEYEQYRWLVIDDNCDGVLRCPADTDRDGFGTFEGPWTDVVGTTCSQPHGRAIGDCAPDDPAIYPRWNEDQSLYFFHAPLIVVGDDVDNDCDGMDECAVDGDGDRWGAGPTTYGEDVYEVGDFSIHYEPGPSGCAAPGISALAGDCEDGKPHVHPGVAEQVGGEEDYDCDGYYLCWLDADLDGWGGDQYYQLALEDFSRVRGEPCSGRSGIPSARETGDCDDTRSSVSPDGSERAGNGVDEDCDGYDTVRLKDVGVRPRSGLYRLEVVGAARGATVALVSSLAGPGLGPCPAQLQGQCAGILTPRVLGSAQAEGDGRAVFDLELPPGAGTHLWLQAWLFSQGRVLGTNVVEVVAP